MLVGYCYPMLAAEGGTNLLSGPRPLLQLGRVMVGVVP